MPTRTKNYVVYVNFPSSNKEYCYLCNIPGLRQGDKVIANNTEVRIVRTADCDTRAIKYVRPVPDTEEARKTLRRLAIIHRLQEIEKERVQLALFKKLAAISPEAKKLLAELRRL